MEKKMDIRAVSGMDNLARKLPLPGSVAAPRKDRYVGMFYFVCNEQTDTSPVRDVEKILAADPTAATNENHPAWGPMPSGCFWGEPLFGYYFTRDEWVIRKHVEMLSFADVDFIVFDTTNRLIFFDNTTLVMRVLSEYARAGYKVPQVAFMTNTESGDTVNELYERIYKQNLYPETWFHWEGKPLIIGVKDECSIEAQEFFTFRASQWPFQTPQKGGFPWMEFIRPQRVFRDENGEAEIINVSVAQHPNCAHSDAAFFGETDAWGRSYHDGHMDTRFRAVDHGFNVQEQWDYALKKDPKIVFLTGWNEWTAGRWPWDRSKNDLKYTVSNEEGDVVHYERSARPHIKHTFCDCCNEEYSRDIEPMKGGYFDNYFFQLIANVRKFKGMPEMPVDDMQTAASIDAEWQNGVTYEDYKFGAFHRNCRGFGENFYKDESGVNDILTMRVMSDTDNLYFSATCADKIARTGEWMRLLIATGEKRGYDACVNFGEAENEHCVLALMQDGKFVSSRSVPMRVCGDTVKYAVPKKALGIEPGAPVTIEFKWIDQIAPDAPVEDYYLHGDAAPYGRLNYRYEAR